MLTEAAYSTTPAAVPGDQSRARAELRDLAIRVDASPGPAADPTEAARTWTDLQEGRCQVIDQFEAGGRRYFIVRRRESRHSKLTSREREVLFSAASGNSGKRIAYELGISQSTVALHLKSAAKKLGYRSRVSLVWAVAAARGASNHCRGSPPR
jgi:DNA-binding NarL/FixJ family response regulator